MTTLPPRPLKLNGENGRPVQWRHNLRGHAGTITTTYRFPRNCGAGKESRTPDLNLGKVALYQLSYSRMNYNKL
jgi:hypothetical protein